MNEVTPLASGDMCLVIDDLDNMHPDTIGQECIILGEEELHQCLGPAGLPLMVRGYVARIQDDRVFVFRRQELRRKRPPACEMTRLKEFVVASFSGRTADCRSADRGSIPRVTATG